MTGSQRDHLDVIHKAQHSELEAMHQQGKTEEEIKKVSLLFEEIRDIIHTFYQFKNHVNKL